MLLTDTIQTAIAGITVNKSRTFLTTLGIMIGVASVVLMVSIGRSFQNYILTQIESFGTNMLEIAPTGFDKFGGNLESLTEEDYEAVRDLPNVESITPVIIVGKTATYGNEEMSPFIMGALQPLTSNYALTLESGRMLNAADEEGAKATAVIGSKVQEDLFGNVPAPGKKIGIGEASFTVVGVFESKDSALLDQMNSIVHIPFSTAKILTGQRHLTFISLRATGDTALVQEDITLLLRDRHNIKNPENDPDKDDFIARSAEQVTAIINSVTLGLTIFLSLVAAISLLVGGIGIMNIMLVSVTERTREIGLRKAVGARKRDILLQFLFEAIALTLTGGAIGIIIGVYFGWIMTRIASKFLGQVDFALSFTAILLAVGMAVGTGLLFGLYPAKRASDLSPMEALRFE